MKRIISFTGILLSCLFVLSCVKGGGDEPVPVTDPAVLSVQVKNAQVIYEVPKSQTKSVEITVKAAPSPSETYNITLKADQGLVAAYNTKYSTDYEMVPAAAYSMVSNSVQLIRHNAESSSCELRLKGDGCEMDQVYVLPIVIDNVTGGTNFSAPEDGSAFILFKMVPAQAQGSGTESDPYQIGSLDEYVLVPNLLKENTTTYFKLMADIDFSEVEFTEEEPWEPIKCSATNKIFFDGNNHKISGLKADAGVFETLVGTVQNLTIDGVEITGTTSGLGVLANVAGSIVEEDGQPAVISGEATIKNVKVTNSKVTADGQKRVGGLVGRFLSGSVENSSAECTIAANNRAGGLIGYMDSGSLKGCSASGDVTVAAYLGGGLVGWVGEVTVSDCQASGNVTSTGGNYVRGGGLIGWVDGKSTIEKSHATGNVTGQGHMAGGLIGGIGKCDGLSTVSGLVEIIAKIDKCYATGNIDLPHGDSGNWAHGGALLGTVAAADGQTVNVSISNSYCTGSVAVRRYSGGFVGSIFQKPATLNISNSYTTSDISGIRLADRCGLVIGLVDGGEDSHITCTGFVAWKSQDTFPFCYPDGRISTEGNYYGNEGTVSQKASALNWDTAIWDFSASQPKLK